MTQLSATPKPRTGSYKHPKSTRSTLLVNATKRSGSDTFGRGAAVWYGVTVEEDGEHLASRGIWEDGWPGPGAGICLQHALCGAVSFLPRLLWNVHPCEADSMLTSETKRTTFRTRTSSGSGLPGVPLTRGSSPRAPRIWDLGHQCRNTSLDVRAQRKPRKPEPQSPFPPSCHGTSQSMLWTVADSHQLITGPSDPLDEPDRRAGESSC